MYKEERGDEKSRLEETEGDDDVDLAEDGVDERGPYDEERM